MRVLVYQIPLSGRSYEFTLPTGPLRERLADRVDILHLGPCQAYVRCERVDQVVTLRGEVALAAEFICSRCAEQIQATLHFPLKHVLMPRSARSGPADEDEGTGYHNGHEIDLAEIVAEQIALLLPEVLLCDAQCQGLCPVCRANLNVGPCACAGKREG